MINFFQVFIQLVCPNLRKLSRFKNFYTFVHYCINEYKNIRCYENKKKVP